MPITFPPGTFIGDILCVDMTIIEDEVFEGEETFVVDIEPVISADQLLVRRMITITIRDNDG